MPAISSGALGRRNGTSCVTVAYASSRVTRPSASISTSAIGVRTQPGQTQFARTPSGPWSRAMRCVSIASAAFDEQ